MKYRDNMNESEMDKFVAELAALDSAYRDVDAELAKVDRAQDEMLETEADLYRYWR